MATVYDIIKGINQAAANAYDGAHEANLMPDGRARVAGLKREDGHYINDRRVMDGFGVVFHGPILRVKYQADARIKDVAKNGFEDNIAKHLADIVKFLKKEYKAITGDTLTLTQEGDHHIVVQRLSNYRTDVQAHCDYRIGGISEVDLVEPGDENDRLDQAVRDWLSLGRSESTYTGGKVGSTRPKNDTREGK